MTNILASNVGTAVLSIFLAVLILLAMVTIHEFGHYVAGRILGFKINEFAIGFGPAIFKRKGKKTGTTFSIRIFPLGGYCAFAGEDGEEEQTEKSEVFDELKEEGDEEKKSGVQPQGANFVDQAPWKRIIVLIAGAFMNYLLALILITVGFFAFGQPSYKIRSVDNNTEYSAEYSFVGGDVILTADGTTVYLATDLISALNGKSAGDKVGFTVLREGNRENIEIVLRSDCDFKNSSEVSKIWRALGAGTREEDGGLYWDVTAENCRFNFGETLGRSFGYSFRMAGSIFKVLGELLTGNLGLNAMGGPVTTIKVTGQMAVQGFESFLQVASYIGVNLAVFNLLPIPALDGSKVIFCLIEWIFRKPVPRKVEAIIHAVGFVLILGFAVLVDIMQFARC